MPQDLPGRPEDEEAREAVPQPRAHAGVALPGAAAAAGRADQLLRRATGAAATAATLHGEHRDTLSMQ